MSKYQIFKSWFLSNNGKFQYINFPTYFPPTNYIGISATTTIPKNTVILSIPKKLIIGIEAATKSDIGFIFQRYQIFQGEDNDDKDFNILALFIIYEKMKKQKSFYFPYLNCIDLAQTMIHWSNDQIQKLGDPFLNLQFIKEVKKQFEPTFQIFKQIVTNNPQHFSQILTSQFYYECYGIVMTRCFGWGLPETMLVPFADFLNHNSNGVHHYTFSKQLQTKQDKQYIKKRKQLNLKLLGIDNHKQLPLNYKKDKRQLYIENNKHKLNKNQIFFNDVRQLKNIEFNKKLQLIRQSLLQQSYNVQLCPSSDDEDNDSGSDQSDDLQLQKWSGEALKYIKQKRYIQKLFQLSDQLKQQNYQIPKPKVNSQFQDNITFSWWYRQQDACFIVSTSTKIDSNQQIYNSYGRRNNRFLLLWYGFTFQNNKYDSVPFRIWNFNIQQQTGYRIFTRYITDVDWQHQIPIGDKRYPYTYLSPEFRLKKTQINYKLLAYIRFRFIRYNKNYTSLNKKLGQIHKIVDVKLQIQVVKFYIQLLRQLVQRYKLTQQRDFSQFPEGRKYFANILIQSNSQIIQLHLQGSSIMLSILFKIQKQNIKFNQQIYKQLNNLKMNQFKIKRFLYHYFKLIQSISF